MRHCGGLALRLINDFSERFKHPRFGSVLCRRADDSVLCRKVNLLCLSIFIQFLQTSLPVHRKKFFKQVGKFQSIKSSMGMSQSCETKQWYNDGDNSPRFAVRFEDKSFDSGRLRDIYAGKTIDDGNGVEVVVKVLKGNYRSQYKDPKQQAKNISREINAAKKAQELADEFLNLPQIKPLGLKIQFLIPKKTMVEKTAKFYLFWFIPTGEDGTKALQNNYVSIEERLHGPFNKFNTNSGFEVAADEVPVLQAFSHWSYEHSCEEHGKTIFLVCDIQGVQNDGMNFVLTDVAIHTQDCRYHETDLGVVGMEMFFAGHSCNSLCRKLGLAPNEVPPDVLPDFSKLNISQETGSTMFRFELDKDQRQQNSQKRSRHLKIVRHDLPSITESD